jgi:phosphotransferase system HPr (HPr) family protein
MAERTVELRNPSGLHARPANTFAEAAAQHDVDITVAKGDLEVNAASVLSILTLDCRQGDLITIRAEGEDAEAAVDGLADLVEDGLGEGIG